MTASNQDELKATIYAAFSDIQRPKNDKIVYDNRADHLECIEIRKAFEDKSWNTLLLRDLYYFRDSLPFFSTEGFRYFLPAFMIAATEHYYDADTLPENVVYALLPPKNSLAKQDYSLFSDKVRAMSVRQREAIRAFLRYFATIHVEDFPNNEPAEALAFWEKADRNRGYPAKK